VIHNNNKKMTYEQIKTSADFVLSKIDQKPQVGIILGTGLGGLIEEIDIKHTFNYSDIPNFPVSTVESHSGKLIFGLLGGKNVVTMQGRFHYYEGYNMQQVTLPVRVMKLLGIEKLIVSNAAGGLNPTYEISDLMVISDHINLLAENPLTGKNLDAFGVRFPDMLEAYDKNLREKALSLAKEKNIRIHEGVYVAVSGPNLETPAEYKFLRIIGADAVGMSTIPEVIVARQMGLPTFAISVITDLCVEGKLKHVTLEEVIAAAQRAEPSLTWLMKELVK
jgi:purine-nucleoside phosphorylase